MSISIHDSVQARPKAPRQPQAMATGRIEPDAGRPDPERARPPARGWQKLCLSGLRFDATLGILSFEKTAPQPIQVDAELNLGPQPLLPRGDAIGHVLDYRQVRELIIEECRREHVNLLETMIGKLSHRLMGLPGVRGVRVRIAKLEIFEDCEVAIRMEAGEW